MSMRTAELQAGPRPQRRDRRFPVALWAVERGGDATYHHRLANLSVAGLFIQKPVPIPVGTEMLLEFSLPGGRTIRTLGTVMHTTATDDGNGSGVELRHLRDEDRDAIADFLSTVAM